MVSNWASGYVTDLSYTHGYYKELSPGILRFASLAKGVESCLQLEDGINYCELGCGQGFSINLLAAANSEIQFYATDFNPEQIAGAKKLAHAAGTKNIHFFDSSFSEFENNTQLPKFDIIALHGIYSWISKEQREIIVRFIERKLKPGGLVYVSYNCMPGWVNVPPLRHLMTMQASENAGSIPSKINESFEFVERLNEVGARYFTANQGVHKRFQSLKELSPNYLAHEYFNEDWNLFYHSDVSDELSRARLSYVASAHLLDHVDAINLTSKQVEFLNDVRNTSNRETLRDYIVNQQFRRDIFSRGAIPFSIPELRERWLDSYFSLISAPDDIPMKVKGTLGEGNLQEETYKPLIGAFASSPNALSLRQAVTDSKLASLGWARLQEAITLLVGMGHLVPCWGNGSASADAIKKAKAFNNAVIERATYSSDLQYLASPVTGSAVYVDRFQQFFIQSLRDNKEDPVKFSLEILAKLNQKIVINGVIIDETEKTRDELQKRYNVFENRLPLLKRLGVC